MSKAIIYGTGGVFRDLRTELPDDIDIVAFADSDQDKATSITGDLFEEKKILSKEEILETDYDCIYVCTNFDSAWHITEDLISIGISRDKIKYLYRKYYEGLWDSSLDTDGNVIHKVAGIFVRERVGNKSDFQTISELLCTNCYSMDIVHPDTIVVDMGMNIGMATLLFARNNNVRSVYSFEPFKDTYDAAIYNISLNPELKDKIHPSNIAVYDRDEDREIRVLTEFAGGRTTEFELIEKTVTDKGERRELIKYRQASKILDHIIKENNNCHIVMKIDTEGAEFEIFKDIEKNMLFTSIDMIMMEYHRQPDELLTCLRKNGFVCIRYGGKKIGMIYAIKI